ncbi:hypothetical protein AB0C52_19300 [Streptomyces sp. NPDC048717]|uniref:hypothetical protein n=1 Tax=Streptomyces sp. NPDC048717 TaxID=3154928 RepID=UPI0034423ADB
MPQAAGAEVALAGLPFGDVLLELLIGLYFWMRSALCWFCGVFFRAWYISARRALALSWVANPASSVCRPAALR